MDPSLRSRRVGELVGLLTGGGRHRFAVLDGGLSTALESLGLRPTGDLWTAQAVLDSPTVVERAHRSAVEAGADVVISASYQASAEGFERAGASPRAARRALASTTELARRSGARLVAASIGPYGASRADGSEYHGRYGAGWDEVRRFHRERLEVLVATQPDLYAIETIPTAVEAVLIVDELRRLTDAPAWVTFSCADAHRTCGGDAVADAADAVAGSVELVGVNCTAPHHVSGLVTALSAAMPAQPLVAYPNAGAEWDAAGRQWRGVVAPADLAAHAVEWAAAGAVLVGGCCGVGNDAVAALAAIRDSPTR